MRKQDEDDIDIRVGPLEEQWPNIRFLGLGAWWGWIWLCYNSTVAFDSFPEALRPTFVFNMYQYSTVALAATMVVLALLWKRADALLENRRVVIASGLAAALATFAIEFAPTAGNLPLFVAAALATGVGTSALCLKVGKIYGSVGLGESITAGALSLLVAAALYFAGIGLPPKAGAVFTALLPLVSALVLSLQVHDPFALGDAELRDKTLLSTGSRSFRKLVAATCIAAFSAGLGKGVSTVLNDSATFAYLGTIIVALIALIALAILFLTNAKGAVIGTTRAYTGLMMYGIVVSLATCFGLNISFLAVGKEAVWLLLSVFMSFIAFRYSESPVKSFSLGQAFYFVFSTAGWYAGMRLAPLYADSAIGMGVGIALAVLILSLLIYILPESEVKSLVKFSWNDMKESGTPWHRSRMAAPPKDACTPCAADGSPSHAPGETGCENERPSEGASATDDPGEAETETGDLLAKAGVGREFARAADPIYGLSAREIEVLALFAQGRSANWIAEHLMISKNTVRTHLRSIYAKLDIHTRQELLDFLG